MNEKATVSHFVAALPDAAFALTAEGRLLCANAAARNIFGGMRDGDPISRAIRAPEILDAIRDARRGTPHGTVWLSRVPLDRQFDVHAAPLGPDPSEPMLVILRDTTKTRRVERMRADFIANASHELRTPLASLLGFVETLQGPARSDPAAQARFLVIMGEQVRRMSRLVDDLLSLSRIEQTLHLRPDEPVDLASVAAHMCDALAPMASDSGVALSLDAKDPVIVRGDRDELLRVAENLIENAIKYGGPGTVEVGVATESAYGVLTVRDYGVGIAPEYLPRLTERFYRVDNAASRAKGGTGLGLAIVKHIAARHCGRLAVESSPGGGARFAFGVPLTDA